MSLLRKNTKRGTRQLTHLSRWVPFFAVRSNAWAAAVAAIPLWAAISLCAAQTSPSAAAPSPALFAGAVISEWKGGVQVQLPGGNAGRPVRGEVLPDGAILETRDGRLVLVMRSDESEILVQPHTRLVIHEPQSGNWDTLQVILGKVRAYIRARTGGAVPFQMGTPSAVIAVRGTRFDVEVNSGGITEVDVFDGLVEVGSATLPGVSVLVGPGMSTRVGMGTAPETPVPTREIRPDVEVPDQMAKLEFAREKALQADRVWDVELGERPDSEVDDAVVESRETEKESH